MDESTRSFSRSIGATLEGSWVQLGHWEEPPWLWRGVGWQERGLMARRP